MSDYKPVKGDRVRVVLEGEVRYTSPNFGEGSYFRFTDEQEVWSTESVVSVKKIEPPVEVFKSGDTVRGKSNGLLYSIARGGYLSHATSKFFEWYPVGLSEPDSFTSRDYEKVNLG